MFYFLKWGFGVLGFWGFGTFEIVPNDKEKEVVKKFGIK
jgi:hypothetical protein